MTYLEQSSACTTQNLSTYGTVGSMPCPCPPPPIDELKFIAYKKVVGSYNEAVQIAIKKKLVLGEPCVIPFLNGDDIELLFAIGSMTEMPFVKDSATLDNLDNASITDPTTKEKVNLVEWIKKIKTDVLTLINKTNQTVAKNKVVVDASIKELAHNDEVNYKKLNTKIDNNIGSLQKQISRIDASVHNMPNILASDEGFMNALVNAMYSNESYMNNLNVNIDERILAFASNFQYKTFYGTLYD